MSTLGPRVGQHATVATGSLAVRDLVDAPSRPARVLGAFDTAIYLSPHGTGRVLAVVTRDGVGLPNAVVLPVLSGRWRLGSATGWSVGGGRVACDRLEVRVDAWRDPRPRLDLAHPAAFVDALGELHAAVRDHDLRGSAAELCRVLVDRDRGGVRATASRILGLGPGLTPSGDDVIAGAVAAGLAVTSARGDAAGKRFFTAVGSDIAELARGRTTDLSASLLWHAAQGDMAEPARHLTSALGGRTSLAPALAALRRVGHRSGDDLAHGIAIGARAAAQRMLAGSEGP